MSGIRLLIIFAALMAGCATLPREPKFTVTFASICEENYPLEDTPVAVAQVWMALARHHQNSPRKIAVFIDGTRDTREARTNIWLLYELAVRQACSEPIVPFYHSGVGTFMGSELIGAMTGRGMGHLIQSAYEFVAKVYRPEDSIFVFGFSRGAYAARSLNGLIEFAGLPRLTDSMSDKQTASVIKTVYGSYNKLNDGRAAWDRRLRQSIRETVATEQISMHAEKVCVEAIGVFDTVSALGLSHDDFPDNHRTDLYARKGFHALALDEQRNDFRPLRFDDRVKSTGPLTCIDCDPGCGADKELHEVWFAGAHADIGGGYPKTGGLGLSDISKTWMLDQFKPYNLFPAVSGCDIENPDRQARCEAGLLHDEFLASSLFHHMGIHTRRPQRADVLHGSLVCRIQFAPLPNPGVREPLSVYRPTNLYHYGSDLTRVRANLERMYSIADYACTGITPDSLP